MTWNLSQFFTGLPRTTVGPAVPAARKQSFAIMEFLGSADSNRFKRRLTGFGFEDVSPIFGSRNSVQSFYCRKTAQGTSSDDDDARFAEYPGFRSEMETDPRAQSADWYMFSGHHGIVRFAETDDEFGGDFGAALNDSAQVGFFNEPYHSGTWNDASKADPNAGSMRNSIFMNSTSDRTLFLPDLLNPFPTPRPDCRGVLCIACNTLAYRHTRIWLRKTFPNAVIFGFWATTPGGRQAVAPFLGAPAGKFGSAPLVGRPGVLNKASFWRDPKAFLGSGDAKIISLMNKLNKEYISTTQEVKSIKRGRQIKGGRADIGMLVEDRAYLWRNGKVSSRAVEDRA